MIVETESRLEISYTEHCMTQNTDTSLNDHNLLVFLREALSSTSLKVKS